MSPYRKVKAPRRLAPYQNGGVKYDGRSSRHPLLNGSHHRPDENRARSHAPDESCTEEQIKRFLRLKEDEHVEKVIDQYTVRCKRCWLDVILCYKNIYDPQHWIQHLARCKKWSDWKLDLQRRKNVHNRGEDLTLEQGITSDVPTPPLTSSSSDSGPVYTTASAQSHSPASDSSESSYSLPVSPQSLSPPATSPLSPKAPPVHKEQLPASRSVDEESLLLTGARNPMEMLFNLALARENINVNIQIPTSPSLESRPDQGKPEDRDGTNSEDTYTISSLPVRHRAYVNRDGRARTVASPYHTMSQPFTGRTDERDKPSAR